jgi:hypothetical protein
MVIKSVNSIKLINVKVKIGYNYYKSFKNIYNKYNSISILKLYLYFYFINYKPSFIFNKEAIFIYFIKSIKAKT